MNPKPLDCKGEINKCKIDIVDNGKNEILRELLKQISRMGGKRKQRGPLQNRTKKQ